MAMHARGFEVVNERAVHGASDLPNMYGELHRERLSRNMLEWQRANRDKCRAYNKKSREKHKDEINAKLRERYNNDPEFRAKKRAADNAREARKREERDAARGPRVEPDLPPEEIERRRKTAEKSKRWLTKNRERHLARRRERRAQLRAQQQAEKALETPSMSSAEEEAARDPVVDMARINANTTVPTDADSISSMRGIVIFYKGSSMTPDQVSSHIVTLYPRFGADDFCSVARYEDDLMVLLAINPPISATKRLKATLSDFNLPDGTAPSHFRLITPIPESAARLRKAFVNCGTFFETGIVPPDKVESSRKRTPEEGPVTPPPRTITIFRISSTDPDLQYVNFTRIPLDKYMQIIRASYHQFKSNNVAYCTYYDIMDQPNWRIECVEELPADTDVATIKAKIAAIKGVAGSEISPEEVARRHRAAEKSKKSYERHREQILQARRDKKAQLADLHSPAPTATWNIARVNANTVAATAIASVRGVPLFYQGTTTTPAQAIEYFKTRYARFGVDDYCISASFGAELFILLSINPPIDAAKRLVATVSDMALPDGTLPSQFRLINPIPESVGRLRKALQECLNSVEAGTVPPDKIESSRKRRAAGIEDIPPNKVVTIFKIFHAESGTQYIGSTRTLFRKYMQIVQGNYNQFKAGKVRHCSYYDIMDKPGWQFVSLEELPADTDVATVKARIAALESSSS